MANYVSPPGLKVAYDDDGSAAFSIDTGGFPRALTTAEMQATNDVANGSEYSIPGGGWWGGTGYLGCIFSYKWDLTGYYFGVGSGSGGNGGVEISSNTTNGVDGSWTTLVATADMATVYDWSTGPPAFSSYRTGIKTVTATGVHAVRFIINQGGFLAGSPGIAAMHLYGQVNAGNVMDLLVPWHPTLNQQADGTTQDFGDVKLSTSYVKTCRFKNWSASFTAHSVIVSCQTLTDTTPSLIPQFMYSTDNVSFFPTLNIGDLAPGAISPLIYVQDSVAPTEEPGVHEVRDIATATLWS